MEMWDSSWIVSTSGLLSSRLSHTDQKSYSVIGCCISQMMVGGRAGSGDEKVEGWPCYYTPVEPMDACAMHDSSEHSNLPRDPDACYELNCAPLLSHHPPE